MEKGSTGRLPARGSFFHTRVEVVGGDTTQTRTHTVVTQDLRERQNPSTNTGGWRESQLVQGALPLRVKGE